MSNSRLCAALVAGAFSVLAAGAAAPASAATLTSFAGDVDCFGLGGSCPDGSGYVSDLGGAFFDDHSTASDPAATDAWDSWGAVSYGVAFNGSAPTSATLETRIAGIADDFPPIDVFFNGTKIGQIPTNNDSNNHEEVLTFDWAVPVALLQHSNQFSFDAGGSDGWDLDYVKLSVDGAAGGVPEPGAWALMILGFAGAGLAIRRRLALA